MTAGLSALIASADADKQQLVSLTQVNEVAAKEADAAVKAADAATQRHRETYAAVQAADTPST